MRELLILGASVRAATQSAARAGFSVVAGDLFADQDTRSVARCVQIKDYPQGLLRLREDYPELPAIYTGAIENYPDFIEAIASVGPLFGNSAEVVRRVRDPLQLQDTLRNHDIPFPATRRASPNRGDGAWLRKSIFSAGGQQVTYHDLSRIDDSASTYYQEFIDGNICSAAYVASHNRVKLSGVSNALVGCSWAGATGFTYCGSIRRNPEPDETDQWRLLGQVVATEFKLLGVFGIDAVVRDQQVIPIEVNPRYTASMELLEMATGKSVMAQHVAVFEGQVVAPNSAQPLECGIGKVILFADRRVVVPDEFEMPSRANIALADIPNSGQTIGQGQPILTIIVRTEAVETVADALKEAARMIRSQLPIA